MIDTDAQLAYGIFWAAYAIAFVVFFYKFGGQLLVKE